MLPFLVSHRHAFHGLHDARCSIGTAKVEGLLPKSRLDFGSLMLLLRACHRRRAFLRANVNRLYNLNKCLGLESVDASESVTQRLATKAVKN